jgi:hypothetical protein
MPLLPDFHVQRYFAPGDTNVFTGPIRGLAGAGSEPL